jgi:hypothetical protein
MVFRAAFSFAAGKLNRTVRVKVGDGRVLRRFHETIGRLCPSPVEGLPHDFDFQNRLLFVDRESRPFAAFL